MTGLAGGKSNLYYIRDGSGRVKDGVTPLPRLPLDAPHPHSSLSSLFPFLDLRKDVFSLLAHREVSRSTFIVMYPEAAALNRAVEVYTAAAAAVAAICTPLTSRVKALFTIWRRLIIKFETRNARGCFCLERCVMQEKVPSYWPTFGYLREIPRRKP